MDIEVGNGRDILLHYLWTHEKGNCLQMGKGTHPDIETPSFDYIIDWSIKEHTDKYWTTTRPNYIDFLPILEDLDKEDCILMKRLDAWTYEISLRPKFFELPFIKKLEEKKKAVKEVSYNSEKVALSSKCKLDSDNKIITIGDYNYSGFANLFKKHKEAFSGDINKVDKKARRKGGIFTIYGILKCREKKPGCNKFTLDEVYENAKGIKGNGWNRTRKFEGRGPHKLGIKPTNCETATTIFQASGLVIRVESRDNYINIKLAK